MPKADQRTLMIAAIWLIGQCSIFVRNREQLANPPISLALDEAAVERLAELVTDWALAGLEHRTGAFAGNSRGCPKNSFFPASGRP